MGCRVPKEELPEEDTEDDDAEDTEKACRSSSGNTVEDDEGTPLPLPLLPAMLAVSELELVELTEDTEAGP